MRPLQPKDLRTPPLPEGSAAAVAAANRRESGGSVGRRQRKGSGPTQSVRLAADLSSKLQGSMMLGFEGPSRHVSDLRDVPEEESTAAGAAVGENEAGGVPPAGRSAKIDSVGGNTAEHGVATQSLRVAADLSSKLMGSMMIGFKSPSRPASNMRNVPGRGETATGAAVDDKRGEGLPLVSRSAKVASEEDTAELGDESSEEGYVGLDELAKEEKMMKAQKKEPGMIEKLLSRRKRGKEEGHTVKDETAPVDRKKNFLKLIANIQKRFNDAVMRLIHWSSCSRHKAIEMDKSS